MNIDKRHTVIVILLEVIQAVFFSVETIIIAMLVDHIIESISGKSAIVLYDVSLLVIFMLLKRMVIYLKNLSYAKLTRSVNEIIPVYILNKKNKIPYQVLETQETQEMMRRVSVDATSKFFEYFQNNISLMEIFAEITGLLVIIATKNILLGIMLFLIMALYMFFSVKNGKYSYEAYEDSEELFRRADYFQEVIKDRKYVEERTLFRFGDYFNRKWFAKYSEAIDVEKKANLNIFAKAEAVNMFSTVVIGCVLAILLLSVRENAITIGFLISVIKSMINYIDMVSSQFAEKVKIFERGVSFYRDYSDFQALPEEESSADGENRGDVCNFNGKEPEIIEFRNVTFSYPGSDKKVLDGFSLILNKGIRYALVGENGVGKSTLLKLLLGIYEDYEGEILIDGINIRMMQKGVLRNLYSFVPQEIGRYEIRLDEYLRTADKAKIRDVFEKIGMDSGLLEDDFALLGKIEEEGRDLSGGQWQLLAIARAILADKTVYILDEPTAAIDPVREAKLYSLFHEIMKSDSKFTILVTHRLGAAKMADRIIVLADGRVKEMGTHEELMEEKGIYCAMYNTQRKWYSENE